MTGPGRQKVFKKFDGDLELIRQNWEGYHLLLFANTIIPKIQDTNGRKKFNTFLKSNGVGSIEDFQSLPSSKISAFTLKKSDGVYRSLAQFQDIPLLECFLKFLEFCRDADPPRLLKIFEAKNQLSVIIENKKILVTLDYAINDIKKHLLDEEKKLKREKLEYEHSQEVDQPQLDIPDPIESNKNYFANSFLDVIGRDIQKIRLKKFLECNLENSKVAWFQLAGVAGQGKSRLAFDLIHVSKELNFRAGFVTKSNIKDFENKWKNWKPNQPHLLIFDDIVGRENDIKNVLQTLFSNKNKFSHKIRILFLERQPWNEGKVTNKQNQNESIGFLLSTHIGDKAQWFLKLSNEISNDDFYHCRFENGIEELNQLDTSDLIFIVKKLMARFSKKKITLSIDAQKILDRFNKLDPSLSEIEGDLKRIDNNVLLELGTYLANQVNVKELSISDKDIEKILTRIDDKGRPLYAYLLAQQLSESPEGFQSWTKVDLLNFQLVREKERWRHGFNEDDVPTWGENHPAMKLVVLATIVGGIRFDDSLIELAFGILAPSLRKKAIFIANGNALNEDIFPTEIDDLKPHLLGEWFVLFSFYKGLKFEGLLDIAWEYSSDKTATFLHRITQDFIDLSKLFPESVIVEKLLAYVPPFVGNYQAMANVALDIAHELERRELVIPQNIINALQYAVILSDKFSTFYLGYLYHQGISVSKDFEMAVNLYRKAIELGNTGALVNLGMCYKHGEGVERDFDKSAQLFLQAFEEGDSIGTLNLAICYQQGEGLDQNLSLAFQLYEQAIELGENRALFNLGICYEKGIGVSQNLEIAIDLYHRAVEKNARLATTYLGSCYHRGHLVNKNIDKAFELYHQAAKQGDGLAQTYLAQSYLTGDGVEKNLDLAIYFYKEAIKKNNSIAMLNLGVCYKLGEGVEKNWNKAIDLFRQAVNSGNEEAKENIVIILLSNFMGEGNYKIYTNDFLMKDKSIYPSVNCFFDPPIMSGNWIQPQEKDLLIYLNAITAPFEILELTKIFDGYFCQFVRTINLSFYKNCKLVDIQIQNPLNQGTILFSVLMNVDNALILDGNIGVLATLNTHLLSFENERSALEYLKFYTSYAQSENSIFQIISNFDEIPFDKNINHEILEKTKSVFASPRYINGDFKNEGWQKFEACVLNGNDLFRSVFKVFSDGKVSMEYKNSILDKLSIFQRQFNGGFRTPLS